MNGLGAALTNPFQSLIGIIADFNHIIVELDGNNDVSIPDRDYS
ncbi:hypothetical protein PL8927_790086 [Planktothrix serta PCC 8927]|uniref:Uncharacterized protein n=1 Tax=Planktothrix serta PCC 8927 TaxID=671068 RepID=A0A7Z9E564_9CYAN|nr:hypothetical protein PL8927_790086 [Planktothrix serta PCC 8927]